MFIESRVCRKVIRRSSVVDDLFFLGGFWEFIGFFCLLIGYFFIWFWVYLSFSFIVCLIVVF